MEYSIERAIHKFSHEVYGASMAGILEIHFEPAAYARFMSEISERRIFSHDSSVGFEVIKFNVMNNSITIKCLPNVPYNEPITPKMQGDFMEQLKNA